MNAILIVERILDAFPSGSYGLLALLRLLDIVEAGEVDTAAVECTSMPRLLINPQLTETPRMHFVPLPTMAKGVEQHGDKHDEIRAWVDQSRNTQKLQNSTSFGAFVPIAAITAARPVLLGTTGLA